MVKSTTTMMVVVVVMMMMMMMMIVEVMMMILALGNTAEPTVPGSKAVVRAQDVWRGGSAEKNS